MFDIAQLNSRCSNVLGKFNQEEWRNEELVNGAMKLLESLSEKDIKIVAESIPDLNYVMSITKEQLLANQNGEIRNVKRIASETTHHYDKVLCYYEGKL